MKRELPEWVKPGASFDYHGRRFHVRGIVDNRAVLREWWRSKQRWHYTVEDWIWFDVCGESLKDIKHAKG